MNLRRLPMIVLALGASAGAARADLLHARETACRMKVELHGPIATVTETHELVGEIEASYELALPVGAAVTGARITPPGRRESVAIAVSAPSLATETPDAERLGIAPDLGLVRWTGSDGHADHYRLRAAPLEATRPLRATVTWTAAAAYEGGRLILRVPARGDGDLAPCQVTVRTKAGGGVKSFGPPFVAGVQVSAGGAGTSEPTRALEVEVVPVWSGERPIASSLSVAVPGPDPRTLTSVAVYVPPPRPDAALAPPRLVLVLDTSRSLGAAGRAATARIADALIAAVPAATPVAVIGFDRTARQLVPWHPARDARGATARALDAAATTGGSDLAEALYLITQLLADGEPARVVIVTDGVLPTRLDGKELLGHTQLPVTQVTIDAIVPLVPGAPLVERGALDVLATTFRGQVIAVRTTELAQRANRLPRELASAPPVRELTVVLDGWPVRPAFPDAIVPGDGAIVHVLTRGGAPRKVELEGARSADAVKLTAIALPPAAAPLAVIAAAQDRVLAEAGALDADDLLALGRGLGLVTEATGLAIIDTSTPTGASRAALARDSGIFTRTPSPGAGGDVMSTYRPVGADSAQADGNLPASTYQYLIKYQLWPQLRACYQEALRGKAPFGGTLDVTLELARGEVSDVRLGGAPMPESFVACVATSAYAIEVPPYPLAGLAETIAVVHKPVILRAPIDADAEVDLSESTEEPPPPPLE